MAELNAKDGKRYVRLAIQWLHKHMATTRHGSIWEFSMFIMALAQLLYGVFQKYGNVRDSYNYIDADVIRRESPNCVSAIAREVIHVRNALAHFLGDETTEKRLLELRARETEITQLLQCLGLLHFDSFDTLSNELKVIYVYRILYNDIPCRDYVNFLLNVLTTEQLASVDSLQDGIEFYMSRMSVLRDKKNKINRIFQRHTKQNATSEDLHLLLDTLTPSQYKDNDVLEAAIFLINPEIMDKYKHK